MAVLSLKVERGEMGGLVKAALCARDLSTATNLDTGAALQSAELERVYALAPRDPWAFCRRGADAEVQREMLEIQRAMHREIQESEAQLAHTVRCLDTGEALSAQDLEQLYSAAPLGSAFDWAARSRAAQGDDVAAVGAGRRGGAGAASRRASAYYQSGSACRVLPT